MVIPPWTLLQCSSALWSAVSGVRLCASSPSSPLIHRIGRRSLPKFLLSALYQRCNNQDILSWWLVSFEPGRVLSPCCISRGIGIQRMGLVALCNHATARYSTRKRGVAGSRSAGPRTMRMAENSGCASLAR